MLYEAAFSVKESDGFRGKNILKNYFLVDLTCIASYLVPPSHWGDSNDSTEGQEED